MDEVIRTINVVKYPDEVLDKKIVETQRLCSNYSTVCNKEDPSSTLYKERIQNEAVKLDIVCEDFKSSAKKNLVKLGENIVTKANSFIVAHSRMLTKFNKLPESPVMTSNDIPLGKWSLGCLKDEVFDYQFSLSFLDYEHDLKEALDEIMVVRDTSSDHGFAQLLDQRKLERKSLSRASSKTLRIIKTMNFNITGFNSVLVVPGNIIAVVFNNKDGSHSVKWRKVKSLDLKSLKTDTHVPPLSTEEYKDVKAKLKKLITIYSVRVRDYSTAESKLEKVSSRFDTLNESHVTEDMRNINAAIAIEDAITAGLKRSIDSLIAYLEKSIEG